MERRIIFTIVKDKYFDWMVVPYEVSILKNGQFSAASKPITLKNVTIEIDEATRKALEDVYKRQVDKRGEEALSRLAKVLEANPDISIIVEGHTDDVPYRGRGEVKDNWDLSVMRATAVVKILLQKGNINPSRITAAGRGEYAPIDPAKTAEARQKNRRTEIILTPKIDELIEILKTD